MKQHFRTFAKKFLSLFLVMTILAPFPFVFAIPEYALAQTSGSGAGATGGSTTSWGQAAASGAVSLSSCMAAAGLTLGGSAGAIGALGAAVSGAGSYLSGVFSSIFGGGASALTASQAAGDVFINGGGLGIGEVGGAAADGGTAAGAGTANAVLAVPVADSGAVIQRTEIAVSEKAERALKHIADSTQMAGLITIQLGIATKKNVFDCIAWAIAKMIWRSIAASVIDWINGGFNGKPAFMQNFDRFLLGIADNIAGQVIQGAGLGFLCSPFQLKIRIALATRYSQRGAPQCTLTQVIANVQNFMRNFQQGGWGAWIQFTSAPQNNPFGGYLLGEATISLRTDDAKSQQSQQLSWGSGFLSLTQQTCRQVPVSVSVAGGQTLAPQMTQRCTSTIQTPGELIAHKLGTTVDAPELSILMADELNEIIDALSQQLILKALNGLFSLSQPTSYGDDFYRFSTPTTELSLQDIGNLEGGGGIEGTDTLILQISDAMNNERDLQSKLIEALSLMDNALHNRETIKACWIGKAGNAFATTTAQVLTATPTSGGTPLTVSFSTRSQNARINFGDGSSSPISAPVCAPGTVVCPASTLTHQYTLPGSYTARLYDNTAPVVGCTPNSYCPAPAPVVLASTVITVGGSATTLTGEQRALAAIEAGRVEASIAPLNVRRQQFSDGYAQSLLVSQSLQELGSRVANVQNAIELGNLSQEFYMRQLSGVYTSDAVLTQMDTVLAQMRNEASVSYQTSLAEMDRCQYFPDVVPTTLQVQPVLGVTPSSGVAPFTTVFNGLALTGSYTLDYGDGTAPLTVSCTDNCSLPTAVTRTHIYTSVGTYTATLTSNTTTSTPNNRTVRTTITVREVPSTQPPQ